MISGYAGATCFDDADLRVDLTVSGLEAINTTYPTPDGQLVCPPASANPLSSLPALPSR